MGCRVLCAVRDISISGLIVNLPNNLTAAINMDEIFEIRPDLGVRRKVCVHLEFCCKIYRNFFFQQTLLLRLRKLFVVGQLLSCVVVRLEKGEGSQHSTVNLSLLPVLFSPCVSLTLVPFQERKYRNFPFDLIHVGLRMWGTVHSIEDHGYIISFGTPNFSGFLRTKHAKIVDGTTVSLPFFFGLRAIFGCPRNTDNWGAHIRECEGNGRDKAGAVLDTEEQEAGVFDGVSCSVRPGLSPARDESHGYSDEGT